MNSGSSYAYCFQNFAWIELQRDKLIRKGEMFKEVSGDMKSEIRKPLSTKTKSPGCNIVNTPQWPTIFFIRS